MTIDDRLEEIIRQLVGDPTLELPDDAPLQDLPGWDSVVQINLMFALEQKLGISFNGSEIFEFETVGQLKRFAADRLPAKPLAHEMKNSSLQ